MNELLILLQNTATLSAPLLLAALGGLMSERSGVVNIGLEGKMLGAAGSAAIAGALSGSPVIGLLAGLIAAILISLFHWLLTQRFGIDHIVSGMGLNLLALGGTSYATKAAVTPDKLSNIPKFPIQFYWVVAALSLIIIWLYIRNFRGGLRLFAVGEDPDKSRTMGLNPVAIRCVALVACGLLCGLSGVLILSNSGGFTDNMTAGRGYIALAALIIGGWRPWPAAIAAILFGLVMALQLQLQSVPIFGQPLPSQLWAALPYIATLIVLTGLVGKSKPPAGLGRA
jgi:simple sugar transport system permease protein